MDRGAWQATVLGVTKSHTTEQHRRMQYAYIYTYMPTHTCYRQTASLCFQTPKSASLPEIPSLSVSEQKLVFYREDEME